MARVVLWHTRLYTPIRHRDATRASLAIEHQAMMLRFAEEVSAGTAAG